MAALTTPKEFNIVHWNTASLHSKNMGIQLYLSQFNASCLCFNETWSGDDVPVHMSLGGYNLVASSSRENHPYHRGRRGGGTAIYLRPGVVYTSLPAGTLVVPSVGPIEACGVFVYLNTSLQQPPPTLRLGRAPATHGVHLGAEDHPLLIVSVYISPGGELQRSHLDEFLRIILDFSEGRTVLILGDLNPTTRLNMMQSWVEEHYLIVLNDPSRPTRGAACLDFALLLPGDNCPSALLPSDDLVPRDDFSGPDSETADVRARCLLHLSQFPCSVLSCPNDLSDHFPLFINIPLVSTAILRQARYQLEDLTDEEWKVYDDQVKQAVSSPSYYPDFCCARSTSSGQQLIEDTHYNIQVLIERILKDHIMGNLIDVLDSRKVVPSAPRGPATTTAGDEPTITLHPFSAPAPPDDAKAMALAALRVMMKDPDIVSLCLILFLWQTGKQTR